MRKRETFLRDIFLFVCVQEAVHCDKSSLTIKHLQECFYSVFEEEVHETIVSNNLFKPGMKIAIAAV